MTDGLVKILDGNTFVVSDDRGDIEASMNDPTGLFSFDTRFLSKWVLTVDGDRLNALSTDDLQYFETRFFLVPGTGTVYVDAKLSVIRWRAVGDGFHERLTILNHDDAPVDLEVRIDAASDFADLFEVKDALSKKGKTSARVEDGKLVLSYERETFRRETIISSTTPAHLDQGGLGFTVRVEPHGAWSTDIHIVTAMVIGEPGPGCDEVRGGRPARPPEHGAQPGAVARRRTQARVRQRFAEGHVPPQPGRPGRFAVLAAERDRAELAGCRPAVVHDDVRPGQHLHQPAGAAVRARAGGHDAARARRAAGKPPRRLPRRGSRPHSPRDALRGDDGVRGAPALALLRGADATPLYLVLLDEYERWTGDTRLVRDLEFEARAALDWIDEYADLMGNGYISYQRRNEETGLENQCWKDSWDSISYSDGRLPGFPRATAELQGYAYDAKVRGARLARRVWRDADLADRLEKEAADLKRRFNRDFWVKKGGYYALALDSDGEQVDALASNNGHLLWSGIVDKARARTVVRHLMGPRLFSGWGVRTLAEGEGRYNPIGYHVGTIWPFDNSFIAWGLRRYGFKEEAARIAAGILDAAEFFQGRLPEAFGGYERSMTKYPVQYPTACSPQAWSTGAPLLFLRTMLGLEPYGEHLVVDPALPNTIGHLELLDIPGRWGRIDAFGRGLVDVRSRSSRRTSTRRRS